MNHILTIERQRLATQHHRVEQPTSEGAPRPLRIAGKVADFVRVMEALRSSGIVARSMSVREIVAHYAFDRSSAKSPEDVYNGTLGCLRSGSRARSAEFFAFVKELVSYLDPEDIEALT